MGAALVFLTRGGSYVNPLASPSDANKGREALFILTRNLKGFLNPETIVSYYPTYYPTTPYPNIPYLTYHLPPYSYSPCPTLPTSPYYLTPYLTTTYPNIPYHYHTTSLHSPYPTLPTLPHLNYLPTYLPISPT